MCVFWRDFYLENLFIYIDLFSIIVWEKINVNLCIGILFLLIVLLKIGLCMGNGLFIFEKDIKLIK